MTKITVFLVALCMSMISSACADTLYRDQTNGFELRYPSRWKAQDLSHSSDLIKANFDKDQQSGAQLRVETLPGVSLRNFIDSNKRQFKKDMETHWRGRLETLAEGSLAGSEEPCTVIAYRFKSEDGAHYFFKQYFWKKGATIYYFQAGTPVSERARVEPLLDEMARSMRFI
jgi:hypothetical protein